MSARDVDTPLLTLLPCVRRLCNQECAPMNASIGAQIKGGQLSADISPLTILLEFK